MDNQKNSVEHQRTPKIEKRREEQKQQESREVKETSREFVEGVSEVVESVENAEVAERGGKTKGKGLPAGFRLRQPEISSSRCRRW